MKFRLFMQRSSLMENYMKITGSEVLGIATSGAVAFGANKEDGFLCNHLITRHDKNMTKPLEFD